MNSITNDKEWKYEKHADETFGKWVKRVREQEAFTQGELAQVMGVSQGTISAVETGEREQPSRDFCYAFGKAVGLSPAFVQLRAGLISRDEYLQAINEANDAETKEIRRRLRKFRTPRSRNDALHVILDVLDALAKRQADHRQP
ncbi:MAG: helix-turn-helix domain-containing protein [Anaerolineae bacterium]|nr:helix-turn-helix domain-containing protein [Anaerolineae bacterium]